MMTRSRFRFSESTGRKWCSAGDQYGLCRSGRLSRERGWRVTRVGTRVRNPLLGKPDAWEQQVLAGFTERAAKGKKHSRA